MSGTEFGSTSNLQPRFRQEYQAYTSQSLASLAASGTINQCRLTLCDCPFITGFVTQTIAGKTYVIHNAPPQHDGTDNQAIAGKLWVAFNATSRYGSIWLRCNRKWLFVAVIKPTYQNPPDIDCRVQWCVKANNTGYCIDENAVRGFPDTPSAVVDTTGNNNLNGGVKQRGMAFGNAAYYGTQTVTSTGSGIADIGINDWPIVAPKGGDYGVGPIHSPNFIEGNPYVVRMHQVRIHSPSAPTIPLNAISWLWLSPKILPFIKTGQFGTNAGANYYNTPSIPSRTSTSTSALEEPITSNYPIYVEQQPIKAQTGTSSHAAMKLTTGAQLAEWYHGYSTPDNGTYWGTPIRINFVASNYPSNTNKPLGNITGTTTVPDYQDGDVVIQEYIKVRSNTSGFDPQQGLPANYGLVSSPSGSGGMIAFVVLRFRPVNNLWEYMGGAVIYAFPSGTSAIPELNWGSYDDGEAQNNLAVTTTTLPEKDRRLFPINNFGASYFNNNGTDISNQLGKGSSGLYLESLCSFSAHHVPPATIKWFFENVILQSVPAFNPAGAVPWNGKTLGENLVEQLIDISDYN